MGRSYNGKKWYKDVIANEQCWWCEQDTPALERSVEHLLPVQYTNKNKGNCKMACKSCNNKRAWFEELFAKYVDGTFTHEFYIDKLKVYLGRIPTELFTQFCSCQKNAKLIEYYESTYKDKAKLHPFQPDILQRLQAESNRW